MRISQGLLKIFIRIFCALKKGKGYAVKAKNHLPISKLPADSSSGRVLRKTSEYKAAVWLSKGQEKTRFV